MDLSLEALFAYYNLIDSNISKTFIFEVSRYWTETKSSIENEGKDWRPWDKVGFNLYLGKIPSLGNSVFSMENQHEQIIKSIEFEKEKNPLGLVVSVVDYFELACYAVVTPVEWEKKNIKHRMLPITDFTANIDNESVIATVLAMRKCIEEGKSVYIHCKAGRSRSAMVVAIYLAMFGNGEDLQPDTSLAEIEEYLISKRPQVSLDKEKRRKAEEVVNEMKELHKSNKLSWLNSSDYDDLCPANPAKSLREMLSSLQIKNAIVHFSSFKKMAVYACKHQGVMLNAKQTELIKDFFMEIYHADDPKWYVDLINHKGPLQELVKQDPYTFYIWNKNKKERKTLRTEFIEELNDYLMRHLHCDPEDIKNASFEVTKSYL